MHEETKEECVIKQPLMVINFSPLNSSFGGKKNSSILSRFL
jgi:hypothetical protein